LSDAAARHLGGETMRKYVFLFKQLEAFATRRTILRIMDFNADLLSEFRATWNDGPLSSAKKLERLHSIFRFAVGRKWIESNPASELKMPKVKPNATLPFSDEEFVRIVDAADSNPRLLAFVCVMRYAGLRISEATTLAVSALQGDKLHLRTEKTGEAVRVPLPGFVLEQSRNVPHSNPEYYFWTGHSKVQAAASVWRKRLAELFVKAKRETLQPVGEGAAGNA
jgi:integrase/recombinase XerD